MGQELSCVAVRAKAYEKAESSRMAIEDGLERMADGIEHAANTVEDAIDRATLPPPTLTRCELSELEWQRGQELFYSLHARQQPVETESEAVVVADAAALDALRACGYVLPVASPVADGVDAATYALRGLPAGHWRRGPGSERAFTLEQWRELLCCLQRPRLLLHECTLPEDEPLAPVAIVPLADERVLLCACANHSPLDKIEHAIDASAAAAAASYNWRASPNDAGTTPIYLRPLGALLVYRWAASLHRPPADGAAAQGGAASARPMHAPSTACRVRAHASLQSEATTLAYCDAKGLILVGTRSGAIQVPPPDPLTRARDAPARLRPGRPPLRRCPLRSSPSRPTGPRSTTAAPSRRTTRPSLRCFSIRSPPTSAPRHLRPHLRPQTSISTATIAARRPGARPAPACTSWCSRRARERFRRAAGYAT